MTPIRYTLHMDGLTFPKPAPATPSTVGTHSHPTHILLGAEWSIDTPGRDWFHFPAPRHSARVLDWHRPTGDRYSWCFPCRGPTARHRSNMAQNATTGVNKDFRNWINMNLRDYFARRPNAIRYVFEANDDRWTIAVSRAPPHRV